MSQQSDIEDGANKCPTCAQPWPAKLMRRVCRTCKRVISSYHKYRIVPVGPLVFAFEHRDCNNPESYPGEGIRNGNEAKDNAPEGAGGTTSD